MSADSPRLSVIIPCYNEARRLGATLADFAAYLDSQDYTYELIVVDDGSDDETWEVIRSCGLHRHGITYLQNYGKGYATRMGMASAQGEFRLVSDADGSTPIGEIEKFWPKFDHGADVVIGSRALPESDIAIHQPWYRQNMGRVYNLLLRALGLTNFPDTQCGFKVYSAHASVIIFSRQRMNGFGADAECLYIAKRHGLSIEQVPVRWLNSADSRVHALFDSLSMIREALTIRINSFRKVYR